MSDSMESPGLENQAPEEEVITATQSRRKRSLALKSLVLLVVFGLGVGGGFFVGRWSVHDAAASNKAKAQKEAMSLMEQINPAEGYRIPVTYKDIGPKLLAAGAIDMDKFSNLYKQQNKPLTGEQMDILTKGTTSNVVISPENSYFLLNFFWALGLANQNSILTDGPMMAQGAEKVGSFASTGGWTLGTKDATRIYAGSQIISLTDEQQKRLLEVASGVYRPCCNNPTHFPDCNHGMAMLGLLELMASQDASVDEMFETAKYVNAFWYPQQTLELAIAFKAAKNLDFAKADSRELVSSQFSSGSGFQAVHQWLSQNGLLEQAPSSGGSCGVQ